MLFILCLCSRLLASQINFSASTLNARIIYSPRYSIISLSLRLCESYSFLLDKFLSSMSAILLKSFCSCLVFFSKLSILSINPYDIRFCIRQCRVSQWINFHSTFVNNPTGNTDHSTVCATSRRTTEPAPIRVFSPIDNAPST